MQQRQIEILSTQGDLSVQLYPTFCEESIFSSAFCGFQHVANDLSSFPSLFIVIRVLLSIFIVNMRYIINLLLS